MGNSSHIREALFLMFAHISDLSWDSQHVSEDLPAPSSRCASSACLSSSSVMQRLQRRERDGLPVPDYLQVVMCAFVTLTLLPHCYQNLFLSWDIQSSERTGEISVLLPSGHA